ncbi:alpha/beta fold hydrolase [Nonomuraea sediminis]|uniref:alpha/beta fold hydrolase n=1 Tax=Nonomuraea sediminis TaxID=2835864 RepID=UPI001BDC45BF|nr:alpha/beta hydrolase [Nonomuraea sediminis]
MTISADGTRIASDTTGSGPMVVLVHGAFTDRRHATLRGVASALAPWFTVVNYDRRGRGDSGDTPPYAVEREIEDVAALIPGTAMVFGGSSGGALVLEAAARLPAITKVAVWEPPYHVDPSAPPIGNDFADRLASLVRQGRRGDAVEVFMTEAAEVPAEVVAGMRGQPYWKESEAVAHTLAYEAAVLGPGNALPAARLATIRQPTLVLSGGAGPAWMANAALAVTAAVPNATHRVLEGQTHNVDPQALAPELLEFFTA